MRKKYLKHELKGMYFDGVRSDPETGEIVIRFSQRKANGRWKDVFVAFEPCCYDLDQFAEIEELRANVEEWESGGPDAPDGPPQGIARRLATEVSEEIQHGSDQQRERRAWKKAEKAKAKVKPRKPRLARQTA